MIIPDHLPLDKVMETMQEEVKTNNALKAKDQQQRQKVEFALNVSPPQQSNIDLNKNAFPQSGFHQLVNINEIIQFEGNPRKYHDPDEYNSIKESIRACGVQHPIHIAKRPNQNKYVVAKGGNTRLQILKELYQETNDSKYLKIPAIFVNYLSEEAILIDHITENDKRANPCFFDKAAGYAELRDRLIMKYNRKFSLRDLCDQFKKIELGNEIRNLDISFSLLSTMMFAHDKLSSLEQLTPYLSKPKAQELRKLYHHLLGFETIKELGEELLDNVFSDALGLWRDQHINDKDINIDQLAEHIRLFSEKHYGIPLPSFDDQQETKEEIQIVSPKVPDVSADHQDLKVQDKSDADHNEVTEFVTGHNSTQKEAKDTLNDKNEVLKNIHKTVIHLLTIVDFPELFVLNHSFKYGFYIERPDQAKINEIADMSDRAMGNIHPDAIPVFWLLNEFSGQLDDWNNQDSPVYLLPDSSPFKNFVMGSDQADFFGSDVPAGCKKIITWLTEPDPNCPEMRSCIQTLFNLAFIFN